MATVTLRFPLLGLEANWPVSDQPALTSPSLKNVRPYDVQDNRSRGGQRPGLRKVYAQKIGDATKPVIALCEINVTRFV